MKFQGLALHIPAFLDIYRRRSCLDVDNHQRRDYIVEGYHHPGDSFAIPGALLEVLVDCVDHGLVGTEASHSVVHSLESVRHAIWDAEIRRTDLQAFPFLLELRDGSGEQFTRLSGQVVGGTVTGPRG